MTKDSDKDPKRQMEEQKSDAAINQQLKAANQQLIALNQQLRASEEKQRSLDKFPEENPHPILRVTKDGIVSYSNEAGRKLLAKWKTGVNEKLPRKWRSFAVDTFKFGLAANSEFTHEQQTLMLTFAPVVDGGYVNIYGLDISLRRQNEEALKDSNQQLRATEQQLNAANQQLQATNQQLNANEQQLRAINQQLRQREEELRRSREVYKGLFEGTTNGIAVYEPANNGKDFIFCDFNPAAEKIEKFKKEDLLGISIQKAFPGAKQMGFLDILKRVCKSGKAEYFPAVVYKDQRIQGWRENYVFKLATGEVVAVYRDITDVKRAEQEIVEKQEQLRALTSKLVSIEEYERKRVAENIHDNLIQPLVFLDIKIKSLLEKSDNNDMADDFDQMRAMLAELIQHSRSFTFDLSYPVLYELGLEAAIEEWARTEIWEKHKIAIEFNGDGNSKSMDHAMTTFLFKAVKELLTNTVKHAEAENATISIAKEDHTIEICVQDDGIGFDYDAFLKKRGKMLGFGLFNIKERLVHLGGNMNIEAKPGCGCKVYMVVPHKYNEE